MRLSQRFQAKKGYYFQKGGQATSTDNEAQSNLGIFDCQLVSSGSNSTSAFHVSGSHFFPINALSHKKHGDKMNSAVILTHKHIQLDFVSEFSNIAPELQEVDAFRDLVGAQL